MISMKKILKLLLVSLLISALVSGCSSPDKIPSDSNADSQKLNIVATDFPGYDFARAITGTDANIKMLLNPGAESHSYEPTPADILAIQNCDVFIYVGGESDTWIDDVLSSFKNPQFVTFRMMDYSDVLEEDEDHEHHHEHEEEHEHGATPEPEYDEHIWTSPRNAIKIVTAMSDLLIQADIKKGLDHHSSFETNTTEYQNKLHSLDEEFRSIAANGSRDTLVFGDRMPFLYFIREYGLHAEAAFSGCSTETEPSVATMEHLIHIVEEEQVPVVFYIELSSEKVADILVEETGVKKLLFHSCQSVTSEEFQNGITYLSLMEQNAQNLKEALN